MRVLSLFDGLSGCQLALKKAGHKVDTYYAAEIDKYAIQVTQANFPNTIQLGDVTKVTAAELGKIDLLAGGSPCQGFSFAGKQLNFNDPRSALFFEFVRLLKECREINPGVLFLLENVKMKKEYQDVISEYLGVQPIEINSALVSAQNRKRLYWTNIPDIKQPEDKGIFLKDILETEVDEKFYLGEDGATARNLRHIRSKEGKSLCCTATMFKGAGNNGMTLIQEPICVASRGRNPENPTSREAGLPTEQMLEPRFDGKTNCLTTVGKDILVMQLNPSTESNGNQPYQQNRVYDTAGISPCLSTDSRPPAILEELKDREKRNFRAGTQKSGTLLASMWKGSQSNGMTIVEEPQFRIRRLTPVECERLQTVPDNYTAIVSNTQRYRMLGNGWTIDVIAHILKDIDLIFD